MSNKFLSTTAAFLLLLLSFISPIQGPAYGQTQLTVGGPSGQLAWTRGTTGCGTPGLVYSPSNNACISPGLAGTVDVSQYAGSDIGLKITNALATCSNSCNLYIPPGAYSFSNQIVLPLNLFGKYKLWGSPGAVLTWTGTTDPIVAKGYIGGDNLIIEGFQLINAGTGSFAGIHLYPGSRITVQNMLIEGFHDGIMVEGVNSSNVLNNYIFNNVNGVTLLSTFCTGTSPNYTCNPGNWASGTLYAANAINVNYNHITNNSGIGVNLLDSPGHGDSGALNDSISYNNIELNGTAIYSGKSVGLLIEHNYFEAATSHQIILGLLGAGAYYGTVGASLRDNYFTTTGSVLYNIELQNTDGTVMISNTEQGGAGVSSANCFVNASTGGEIRSLLVPTGIVQGISVGNRLCINGSPAQTFVGTGSFVLYSTNFKVGIAYAQFAIGNGTSDTQAAVNVAPSSTCFAAASNNAAEATAQSLISQVYIQPGNGSFTIFHPSGHAGLLYDAYCTQSLN